MGVGLEHRMEERPVRRACLLGLLTALGLLALHGGSSGVAAASADADLAVTKSDSPDPVTAGAPLTYTVQVINAGPDPAAAVILVDELPRGVTSVNAQSTQGVCVVNGSGRKVTCTLGTVGVNVGPQYNQAPLTVTISVLAPTGVGKGRTITNKASVDSDTKDPRRGNDSATARTLVVEAPALSCRGREATIV